MRAAFEVPGPRADQVRVRLSHSEISLFPKHINEQPPLQLEQIVLNWKFAQVAGDVRPPHRAEPPRMPSEARLAVSRNVPSDGDESRATFGRQPRERGQVALDLIAPIA